MPRRNARRQSVASNFNRPAEILETRQVPAGFVLASVSAGVLTITGDNQANNIQVNPNADGSVTVRGRSLTSVNGSLFSAATFTGVQNITVQMNGGNDTVAVGNGDVDSTIPVDLNIDMGAGADTVDLRRLTVGDDVQILTGDGNDLVRLEQLKVGGLGVNSNQNDLLVDTSRASSTGSDVDQVLMYRLTVARNATILTGADADNVVNDDRSLFVVGFPTSTPFTDVAGDLSIQTGDGNDVVDLDLVRVIHDLNVDLNDGNDRLAIRRSVVVNEANLDGGDDNDTLLLIDSFFGDLDLDSFEL
ncbi:MAG: hypothetical protein JNL58_25155 [Planctomyces sp.]|nr:hypothetical protein [Planctomyces sp.]